MKQLPEQCKKAIAEQRCLVCVGVAEDDWIPPKKCHYLVTTQENIKITKQNLGVDNNEYNSRNYR